MQKKIRCVFSHLTVSINIPATSNNFREIHTDKPFDGIDLFQSKMLEISPFLSKMRSLSESSQLK